MRKMIAAVAAGAALAASASAALADTAGFTLDITAPNGNAVIDTPIFTLRNISQTASLTSFSLMFNPNPNNIDRVTNFTRLDDKPIQLNWTIVTPDASDGGVRSDGVQMTFTGFEARDPDEGLKFSLDFDPDSGSSTPIDFRTILWNNGALNNAVLTVGFSDGQSFTQTLPDSDPSQREFHFSGQTAVSAVPEPATWAMMILGLGGVGAALRNRRRLAPVVVS